MATLIYPKESAMLNRQRDRLRIKLMQIDASLKKRPQKPETVERRIGKWLGRNTAAEKVFHVEVIKDSGLAVGLNIEDDIKADLVGLKLQSGT